MEKSLSDTIDTRDAVAPLEEKKLSNRRNGKKMRGKKCCYYPSIVLYFSLMDVGHDC